jgi:CRISPR-associated protein Cmr2
VAVKHLLAISIGPVQGFIAAARRTADLAAGSGLLVEAAHAAAAAIDPAHGRLIFPAGPETEGPNKILAEVSRGDPAEVARLAREAARAVIARAWQQTAEGIALDPAGRELGDRQVEAFLEFSAAWWPLDGEYPHARRQVERLLAGRKALREFAASPAGAGRPKSPLDPSRDCVLPVGAKRLRLPEEAVDRPPFFLKAGETLDAVSLIKRAARGKGRAGEVPSTSLMALGSLLPDLEKTAAGELEQLRELAGRYGGRFDLGDLFFDARLDEEGLSEEERGRALALRQRALQRVRPGRLAPYYAVLIADGDRMGRLIDGLATEEEHRQLSLALAEFAVEAGRVVAGHGGFLVYSGGDDVLALLPANRAIACAADLAETFGSRLAAFGRGTLRPSLSAGIVLVHHMEPLQLSLERARSAERAAKNRDRKERNSLAVAYHPRGGAPIAVPLAWPVARQEWGPAVAAFRSGLSPGFPYELRELARELEGTGLSGEQIGGEAERIAQRKKGGSRERGAREDWAAPRWVERPADLRTLADLLAIARFLAALPEPAETRGG